MTLVLGILCSDGVVIGSDSAATFGSGNLSTIGQQYTRKIHSLQGQILYTNTGAVGISQLIMDVVGSLWLDGKLKQQVCPNADVAMDTIGRAIVQKVGPYLQLGALQKQILGEATQSLCKSLIALPVDHKPCLLSFDYNGAPERATTELPFVAFGSGQVIADPFLAFLHRLLWKDVAPTVAEGRLAAAWTIEHTVKTNPGGVGGEIQLATLSIVKGNAKVEMLGEGQIAEHRQRITAAEDVLVAELRGTREALPPNVPAPDS